MFVVDGKEANAVSRSHFVKMAGHSYRNLTDAERKVLADQISADDAGIMTPVEVEGQVRRITKKIKSQAGSGLGCLGGWFYFSLFCSLKSWNIWATKVLPLLAALDRLELTMLWGRIQS